MTKKCKSFVQSYDEKIIRFKKAKARRQKSGAGPCRILFVLSPSPSGSVENHRFLNPDRSVVRHISA